MIKITVKKYMAGSFQDKDEIRRALLHLFPDAFSQEVVIKTVPDNSEVCVRAEKIDD